MSKNEKKICFIICTNNSVLLEECILYLSRLRVPQGMEMELISIPDATSMLAGYKEAVEKTDAKYKVFMHQDVFILNKNLIEDLISIFHSNAQIGMIGMAGSKKMPKDCIMWSDKLIGNIFFKGLIYDENYVYNLKKDGITEAESVDGLLIATSQDICLRTDILDGWDFYDVSMAFEMRRAGFRVVVPNQIMPWVIHDDGEVLNMSNYNHYRQIVMKEYKDLLEK